MNNAPNDIDKVTSVPSRRALHVAVAVLILSAAALGYSALSGNPCEDECTTACILLADSACEQQFRHGR
jgi:hypothetical protein